MNGHGNETSLEDIRWGCVFGARKCDTYKMNPKSYVLAHKATETGSILGSLGRGGGGGGVGGKGQVSGPPVKSDRYTVP